MEAIIFLLAFWGFCFILICILAKANSNLDKQIQAKKASTNNMIAERINELVKEVIEKENLDIELDITGEDVGEVIEKLSKEELMRKNNA